MWTLMMKRSVMAAMFLLGTTVIANPLSWHLEIRHSSPKKLVIVSFPDQVNCFFFLFAQYFLSKKWRKSWDFQDSFNFFAKNSKSQFYWRKNSKFRLIWILTPKMIFFLLKWKMVGFFTFELSRQKCAEQRYDIDVKLT